MSDTDSDYDIEPPDVSSWLLSFLSQRRGEYEAQYAFDDSEEERVLSGALKALERRASALITSGVIPSDVAENLHMFMPGDPVEAKVRRLLSHQIVNHRLEFDLAEDACARLSGVDERVQLATLLTMLLLGYKPSATVLKYFERATTLYLAGYETEAIIMCGAVLEAALRARFSDDLLTADGMRPSFKRTRDFSVGQRLEYEQRHPVLDESHRKRIRDVMSWRNDAVHVQPDLGPNAAQALAHLVLLLPKLLPFGDSD